MKRTFYIGLATVLMFACGKSDSTPTTAGTSAESTPGTLPANNPNAASAPQDQVVVLTGCLQGGERAGSGVQ